MGHPSIVFHKVVNTRLFAPTEKNCRLRTWNTTEGGWVRLKFSDTAVLLLVMIYPRRFFLNPEARNYRRSWEDMVCQPVGSDIPFEPLKNYPTRLACVLTWRALWFSLRSSWTAPTITSHDDKKHCAKMRLSTSYSAPGWYHRGNHSPMEIMNSLPPRKKISMSADGMSNMPDNCVISLMHVYCQQRERVTMWSKQIPKFGLHRHHGSNFFLNTPWRLAFCSCHISNAATWRFIGASEEFIISTRKKQYDDHTMCQWD